MIKMQMMDDIAAANEYYSIMNSLIQFKLFIDDKVFYKQHISDIRMRLIYKELSSLSMQFHDSLKKIEQLTAISGQKEIKND